MKIKTALVAGSMIVISVCAFPAASSARRALDALTVPGGISRPNPDHVVLDGASPLTSAEMQDLRGGFMDPTGIIYNFDVNVQTNLNGNEIFTRSLTISPSGAGGQLQATANVTMMPTNLPDHFSLNMIGNGQGITITNTSGASATVLNQVANGAPASIIMNSSNNSNLSQSINVSLALKNLSSAVNFAHLTAQPGLVQNQALRSLGFR